MRQFVFLLIFSALIAACGLNQSSPNKTDAVKAEPVKADPTQSTLKNEPRFWKVASYAGDLGDNKNSSYITNAFAVWGTYSNRTIDQSEVKVKFLIDKISFCIKLYENGNKIVKKGDETNYKITVKQEGSEPVLFTAKNVSDRIFIPETDAGKLKAMFGTGKVISFSMVSDSKINPSAYSFLLDHPGGFSDEMDKISK
jgi:hypothetical protein